MVLPLVLAFVVGITERCLPEGGMSGGYDYAESVRKAGDIPVLICRTAKPEDADEIVSKIDMLLLTGGEDVNPARYGEKPSPRLGRVNAVRDAFEDGLMRAAVRQEKPIFGTCRGHQHVNVFFGGTLHQDLPSELGERYTVLHSLPGKDIVAKQTNRTHRIEIAEGSRLARACGQREAWVNSMHHQAVKGVAPGMTVTAWTEDGVAEAIECGWYPAAGVQFHPECLNAYASDPVWERFYRNLRDYVGAAPKVALPERPIGVFDSGIGGLSVLERILKLDAFDNATGEERADGIPDFADEEFVYFGDQANMPYGRYDAAGKADFLRELVVRDAQFVLGSEGHAPSKVAVIACNTATAYGLGKVQAMPRPHDAEIIGVVNAGVQAALDETKGEAGPYAIGVMATPATISSGVYERTIRGELKARGVGTAVEVASRGGVGLAEAVENSEPGMRDCARTNVIALVEEYRARGGKAPIKALILGCTHYPFVLDTFRETIAELRKRPEYAALVAEDLKFIDPAVYTAIACYRSLRKSGLLKPKGTKRAARRVSAFISVGKDGPLSDEVKYGRECGCRDLRTKIVPLGTAGLPPSTVESIGKCFPACKAELGL